MALKKVSKDQLNKNGVNLTVNCVNNTDKAIEVKLSGD